MFPPNEHAPISPSRLQRIIDCPGSYKLARDVEEGRSSSYAAEGTHMHAAVEAHLLKYKDRAWSTLVSINIVDPPLNDEQRSAVQDCVDYLAQVIKPLEGPSLQIQVEKKVYLKEFHSILYDCYGTCDVVLTTDTETHVIDWKFGKGVPVYAENNDQLMAYLVGAVKNFESLFVEHPHTAHTYHIHVVQPRLDIFDHIELTATEIDTWLSIRTIPGVTKAYEKHAPFIPGQKQCRWCPAKAQCRARYNMAQQTAADIFKAATGLADEVSIEEISEVLAKAKMYQDYIKDLHVFVQNRIKNGQTVLGWKMVHGRSLRRWEDSDVAEDYLSRTHGLDSAQLFVSKFISPAQAEKLVHGSKKDEEFQALIIKPEGKPTLVVEGDKRQPIEYKTATEIFKEAT